MAWDTNWKTNPKPETRNPNEARNPKPEDGTYTDRALFQASSFGFLSDFGIRPSDFPPDFAKA
jgi:hypothetical protein